MEIQKAIVIEPGRTYVLESEAYYPKTMIDLIRNQFEKAGAAVIFLPAGAKLAKELD